MTTQRVIGDTDMQLATMSTKATAFTIDQLLRPDLHINANHDNENLHQQKTAHETAHSTATECRLRTGEQLVQHWLIAIFY